MFCGVRLDSADVAGTTGGSVATAGKDVAVFLGVGGTGVTAFVVVVLVANSGTCGGNPASSIAPLSCRWICSTLA